MFEENRPTEGKDMIETALRIDPRMPSAYNSLALYYVANNTPEVALARLLEGVKHCPQAPGIRFDLGNIYSSLNQPREAIEQFELALDLGTDIPASTLHNIGNQLIKVGEKARAITYYNRALEQDEMHFGARHNLAIANYEIGNIDSARAQANRLIELDPDGDHGAWARKFLRKISE